MEKKKSNPQSYFKKKSRATEIVKAVLLIIGALLVFFPFYWAVIGSLKTKTEFWQYPPSLLPETPMWSNYTEALEGNIARYILNSVFVAGMIVIWQLVSSAMFAYALVRFEFRSRKLLFAMVLLLQMMPAAATHIPDYVILANMNLLDTYVGLIISNCASVFGIFLLRQYFLQVDKGLIEAAQIDGAGDLRILWRIMLPVSKPGVIMILLNGFVGNYNNYVWPSLITKSPEKYLVSQGIRMFFVQESAYGTKYPQMMAANVMVIIPMLILFGFAQNWFEGGIADTGSKG